MNDLQNNLAEYRAIIIEERRIEKEIKEFFQLLATRDNPRYDRCSDYGERIIQIVMPIDEFNMDIFSVDNIDKIKTKIIEFRNLRNRQKKLENEINQDKAINRQMKLDLEMHGGNTDI